MPNPSPLTTRANTSSWYRQFFGVPSLFFEHDYARHLMIFAAFLSLSPTPQGIGQFLEGDKKPTNGQKMLKYVTFNDFAVPIQGEKQSGFVSFC
jgi:hypothetical protein